MICPCPLRVGCTARYVCSSRPRLHAEITIFSLLLLSRLLCSPTLISSLLNKTKFPPNSTDWHCRAVPRDTPFPGWPIRSECFGQAISTSDVCSTFSPGSFSAFVSHSFRSSLFLYFSTCIACRGGDRHHNTSFRVVSASEEVVASSFICIRV